MNPLKTAITTKTAITAEEARALLVRAIEEKGADYVYEKDEGGACIYVKDGQPDCLIGHVLAYLDVPMSAVVRFEGGGAARVVTHFFPDTPAEVRWALEDAQAAQDRGDTWGGALESFDLRLAAWGYPDTWLEDDHAAASASA